MYERKSLNIDPDVSANFFAAKLTAWVANEWKSFDSTVKLQRAIYGGDEDWEPDISRPNFPKDYELEWLSQAASELPIEDRERVILVHNWAVTVLRNICNSEIKKAENVKVRDGLVIPREWHVHYENLYVNQSPKLILAVLQHAFTGNPMNGELFEWTNRGKLLSGTSKKAIVGASIIGAGAAFLLGG